MSSSNSCCHSLLSYPIRLHYFRPFTAIIIGVLLSSAILWSPPLQAGLSHYAGLDWKVLRSEHFEVVYHDGAEPLAHQAIAIAEAAHARLAPLFQWTPREPTYIILTDEFGVSNGYATPIPDNRSGIFIAPPDRLNSLEDHDGWLQTVITHEYVHILHMDKVRGFPGFMRKIFGRWPSSLPFTVFPNAFQPPWVLEGMATYYETDRVRGIGRGQSSYFDMLMRMEVASGVKSVRQVNQPMVSWPGGTARYLYGVQFFNFVVERKGEDKIQQMVYHMSNDGIPFRINSNTKYVFRKRLVPLWQEFTDYLEQKYRPQIARLREQGLHQGERLTKHGYSTGMSRMTPNGTLYYVREDWRRRPALIAWRPGAKRTKVLTELHSEVSFDWHPTAGIVLAQTEVCGNNRYYLDLYRVDTHSGRKRRLTHCGRYHYAAWMPDGDEIIAARLALGVSSLQRLSDKGEVRETLWRAQQGEVLAGLDVSPDGQRLVSALWQPQSGWNLAEFDLTTRQWRLLTQGGEIEMQASYTADGSAVIYSSDADGVYNIRRLDLASGRNETLTHVVGGAFHPQLSSQGELYYTGYSGEGFDIHRLQTPTATPLGTAVAASSAQLPATPTAPAGLQQDDYSPWASLRPRWWFPHLAITDATAELGFLTSGWDVLQRHIYIADLAYDVDNDWAVGSFDYIYDRWWPMFKYHTSRYNSIKLDDDDEPARVRREDVTQFELVFPWLRQDWYWSWHWAALQERESDGWLAEGILEQPELVDRIAGTALVFNSSRRFPRGISRSDGRLVQLIAEDSEMIEGGDYTGAVYTIDWREYLPLFGEHVFAVRLAAGWGTDIPQPFELGGSDSAYGAPALLGSTLFDSPFNRREYALRGYPEGSPALTGRRMHLTTLEYRFPLYRLERGITVPPIGVHQWHGSLFVDRGATWNTDESMPDRYVTGAGIELYSELVLFYGGLLNLRAGYAHGYHEGGENKTYLQIGSSF